MSHGSLAHSNRLTVAVSAPPAQGGDRLFEVAEELGDYSHTISAFGGFDAASFTYAAEMPVLEQWFEHGLGRVITVYDENLAVIWQGFVDQVSIRMAGLELTRGPLTQLVNRLQVVYSSIDTTTEPPTVGVRKRTATVDDLASQARWGIWSRVLSIAGATDDNADQVRDLHLHEYREPETSGRFSSMSSGDVSLTVQCKGFIHALNYPYNQTAQGGLTTASEKVRAILQADPNGWINADLSGVEANGIEVSRWENDDNLALGLLRGLAAMGDDSSNRRLFGVYEERRAVYGPTPATWEYEVRLADARRVIRNRAGGEVPPWAVRPGRWMMFIDFLPGHITQDEQLQTDPRMLFIESVVYRLPMGLEISGGKANRMAALLARLGLGGTSV
ncbi:MAG: hypothetical protein QM346_11715 [Chloroflexota bacterium]|nr:hypothetical protein [Chloroflexota bacterium]